MIASRLSPPSQPAGVTRVEWVGGREPAWSALKRAMRALWGAHRGAALAVRGTETRLRCNQAVLEGYCVQNAFSLGLVLVVLSVAMGFRAIGVLMGVWG